MRNIGGSAIEKALAAVVMIFVGGCATVAQVTSLSDQNCRHTFVDRMSSILVEQGEKQEVADKLAESTTTVLLTGSLGPRPFLVASPSGADYGFFVEQKSSDCLCGYSAGRRALLGTGTISRTLRPVSSMGACVRNRRTREDVRLAWNVRF